MTTAQVGAKGVIPRHQRGVYYYSAVDPKPLTIEQQKDYVRRYIEGCETASRLQEEEARTSTPEQKWNAIEAVQDLASHNANEASNNDGEENGLVIQQRYFMKLHRRP